MYHGHAMTGKPFPDYWPIVRESVDSPHDGTVMRRFDIAFVVGLNKQLWKQTSCRWFQMPW